MGRMEWQRRLHPRCRAPSVADLVASTAVLADATLPPLETGDWLVFRDMGAYPPRRAPTSGMALPDVKYYLQAAPEAHEGQAPWPPHVATEADAPADRMGPPMTLRERPRVLNSAVRYTRQCRRSGLYVAAKIVQIAKAHDPLNFATQSSVSVQWTSAPLARVYSLAVDGGEQGGVRHRRSLRPPAATRTAAAASARRRRRRRRVRAVRVDRERQPREPVASCCLEPSASVSKTRLRAQGLKPSSDIA